MQRQIPFLLHFSPVYNLSSIIDHGIVSRQDLDAAEHDYLPTDLYRIDGKPNTISLSISHINYSMFARKCRDYPSVDWVVLLLSPAILWEKPCRFCYRNAASRQMTSKRGAQAGPKTFEWLFIAEDGSDFGSDPAYNDAEVLVYGRIEQVYIRGAWTDRMDVARYVQAQLDRISGEDLTTYVRPFAWPGLLDGNI